MMQILKNLSLSIIDQFKRINMTIYSKESGLFMAFQTRMSDALFKKRTGQDVHRRRFGLILTTNKDASD